MKLSMKSLFIGMATAVVLSTTASASSGYKVVKRFKDQSQLHMFQNRVLIQCPSEPVGGEKIPGQQQELYYSKLEREWCWARYSDTCRKTVPKLATHICEK